ncbi:hypothetical protein VTN77DRAFT_8672 [Rasamsonia byssochlamydoides]|uniref:uncharacterized protein n=1 Tax=Rasamsonia byssochlamydoides TaxID=89139 RepID=UPI003742FA76
MYRTQFITWDQYQRLDSVSGTRYKKFVGIHAGSLKEPDTAVRVRGRQTPGIPEKCPIWVDECGYSETTHDPDLDRDINLWINGTGGGVLWGVQTKFYK